MSSSTTQKTEIEEMSDQEKELMQASLEFMPILASELGYDMAVDEAPIEDDPEYKLKANKVNRIQADIDALESQNAKSWSPQTDQLIQSRQQQLREAEDELETFQADYTPVKKYDIKKKQDPYEAELIRQYGQVEGSRMFQEEQGQKAMDENAIAKEIRENTMKFLSGDFTLNDNQKKYVSDLYAPVRVATEKMFSDIDTEIANTDTSMSQALSKYMDQINKTGMDIGDALTALGTQVEKTGVSMNDALTNTIKVREQINKMGIEDATGQITKNAALNAAMLGRSPDDPEYMKEVQDSVSREITRANLELGAMEAQGRLGIAERTGAGLEDVYRQRVSLAERTGGAMEGAYQQGYQQAGMTGGKREENVYRRGAGLTGIAEGQANLEYGIGAGLPPTQIQTGMASEQYRQALAAQSQQNAAAMMNLPTAAASPYREERFAQPTTTTTRSYGVGDFLGDVIGVAGGVGSAYLGFRK